MDGGKYMFFPSNHMHSHSTIQSHEDRLEQQRILFVLNLWAREQESFCCGSCRVRIFVAYGT